MPGTKNRTKQPPANARVRRAAHLERQRELKIRKRLRGERAVIHQAMEQAAKLMLPQTILITGPFRALDQKDSSGWIIVGANGQLAMHMSSRDKARFEAKHLNDEGCPSVERSLPAAVHTSDEGMLYLGFERVHDDKLAEMRVTTVAAVPIEEKYRKVTS